MNRQPHARRPPSRGRDAAELVAFLLVIAIFLVALTAVDPAAIR